MNIPSSEGVTSIQLVYLGPMVHIGLSIEDKNDDAQCDDIQNDVSCAQTNDIH